LPQENRDLAVPIYSSKPERWFRKECGLAFPSVVTFTYFLRAQNHITNLTSSVQWEKYKGNVKVYPPTILLGKVRWKKFRSIIQDREENSRMHVPITSFLLSCLYQRRSFFKTKDLFLRQIYCIFEIDMYSQFFQITRVFVREKNILY